MGHQIQQPAPNEVRVELFGSLDQKGAELLERELETVTSRLAPKSFAVVLNLIGMTDCARAAREALVRIQTRLRSTASRTAWLDDRPRFRGLALWVMHLAEDGNAKAVATPEQAKEWLSNSIHRVEDARQRAEAGG